MSLKKSLVPVFALLLFTTVGYAQEAPASPQDDTPQVQKGPREGRRHGRIGRHGAFAGMHELNFTEEQRQQQRAILRRRMANTKTQREDLFKLGEKRIDGTLTAEDEARARVLRQEIRNSMEGVRSEMESVLTAEQRAKLEQLKTDRKARRAEMREHRRELRERRDTTPR
jgi:Spy/CpxP family protein refolding chaperone